MHCAHQREREREREQSFPIPCDAVAVGVHRYAMQLAMERTGQRGKFAPHTESHAHPLHFHFTCRLACAEILNEFYFAWVGTQLMTHQVCLVVDFGRNA